MSTETKVKKPKSNYITGFCGTGAHEGLAPVSPSGKPMKVCTAHEICSCKCHITINKMYEMAGAKRKEHGNPNYEPPEPTWMGQIALARADSLIDPARPTQRPEQPASVAPTLSESARTFEPTSTGTRARGQLEVEVQKVCIAYQAGKYDLDGPLTPAQVGLLIDPENPPSSGAIGAVFDRWSRIGYAQIHRRPIFFSGLTLDGMQLGLEAMKQKAKRR
ncbi:hypothetical protein SEA_BENCZKOWSKI14_62 [Gordonia phage Benczkowski14]|uniref:Uncharacterized protein n=3 Tax=Demosthenesvirus katyusha TaxID=1982108 RepID=A0A142KCD9_9CAUD|nr:hypothetical protein BH765_gp61 [Gordonia phage Kvothe]YP_009603336.1 hypothetical protein FDH67_gp62 [Gordonia phage Katyusha]AMS03772.1 hypothetical protein SEA_BENCZKOWSKI14_62 [Gordonia phage Benczkowski14]UJD20698.1 hypothetical protein SEA_NIAGARA_62 [Gordonia phage Niagara]AMS03455.1 hypothetical protein SEA_KATYUSHA_62 [Gordonia phage Katyusha]ANA86124.1 hypothetical protein PBI_KVOTHE_61 [Gordonia phage Kvothe]